MIATPKIDNAAPLRYAMNTLNAFQFAYGEGPGTVHAATTRNGASIMIVPIAKSQISCLV